MRIYCKHKCTNTPIYKVWKNIKSRCHNPNNNKYKNYGGRGIKVCNEWINNSSAFIKWALNNGWENGLQIDRTNNNEDYSPDNCRFITNKANSRNTRWNRLITYKGETKTIADFAEIHKIKYTRLLDRVRAGWCVEKAIEKPCRRLSHFATGEKTNGAKLKEYQVILIKKNPYKKTKAELAKEFGVRPNTITRIFNGETWCHLKLTA